jgi:hypothetical protein
MKRSISAKKILVLMVLFFTACSAEAGQTQPTPTPDFSPTPSEIPTSTETPLPTATATIIRLPTQDFNQPSSTPFIMMVDGNTVTPMPSPTSSKPGIGFFSLTYSPKKIYWGACQPNSVTISATVDDPDEVFSVLLFYRVKDYEEEDYTPWNTGVVMLDRGQGVFTHTMVGSKIDGHNHYLKSWVYFQLIATNLKGEEIGRTRIYDKAFEMYPCPCLTPQKGCPPGGPKPTITPTPKKGKP